MLYESIKKTYRDLVPAVSSGRRFVDFFVIRINAWRRFVKDRIERKFDAGLERDIAPLSLPLFDSPDVSIIIPIYNKFAYTYTCLKSVVEKTEGVGYEAILVDCRPGGEAALKDVIKNALIIKKENTPGPVEARNLGAEKAKGRFLLFLDDDTKVITKDWLFEMVKVLKKDAKAGMAGARLVSPEGSLREAGGIIWNDADNLSLDYGRGKDPDNYEFNYLKEADFLSGACILIRRDVFDRCGRLDAGFAPAYAVYDLSFKARELGYKAVYQPKAFIVHFDNGAASKNGPVAADRKKFFEKWKRVIERDQFVPGAGVFLARDRAKGKKVVLFVDYEVPAYDRYAGSLTMHMYIKLLVELGFKVVFLADNLYRKEPYASRLQQEGVEVIYGPFSFDSWIKENGRHIRFAWLSRPNIAVKYLKSLRRHSSAKILYYIQDLHYVRTMRSYEIKKKPELLKEAGQWKKLEFRVIEGSDVILSLSDNESAIIRGHFPGKNVQTIPLFFYGDHELKRKTVGFEDRAGLIFVGGFGHDPNVDAVLYFVEEIFPAIQRSLPDIKLYVVGSNPPEKIKGLESDSIKVTGFVEDIGPYLEAARVMVAPLRYGAGVKGKIISGMLYGAPVVTTSVGNEGLDLKDGFECMLGDGGDGFASKVIRLYTDKELWEKVSSNANKYLGVHFSKDRAKDILNTIFEDGMAGDFRSPGPLA